MKGGRHPSGGRLRACTRLLRQTPASVCPSLSHPLSQSAAKPEVMYAAAAGHALLGALCLWRGFDEDEKWEKELWAKKD